MALAASRITLFYTENTDHIKEQNNNPFVLFSTVDLTSSVQNPANNFLFLLHITLAACNPILLVFFS